jgi:hypothetical protein
MRNGKTDRSEKWSKILAITAHRRAKREKEKKQMAQQEKAALTIILICTSQQYPTL